MISHPLQFLSKSYHLSEDLQNTEANLIFKLPNGFSKGSCWTYSSWCEFHCLKSVRYICALGQAQGGRDETRPQLRSVGEELKKMNLAFIWIYLWKMYKFSDTNDTAYSDVGDWSEYSTPQMTQTTNTQKNNRNPCRLTL